jgi:hypothetical protein
MTSDCPHAEMITPGNVAAAFRPLRPPETCRSSEGWVVCWALPDLSRYHLRWYCPPLRAQSEAFRGNRR